MARCNAMTRAGTRCTRTALPPLGRCWQHTLLKHPLVLLILALVSVMLAVWQVQLAWSARAREQKLAEIDAVRVALQDELDKQKLHGQRLVGGVGLAADWAGSLAESNDEVRGLANALADLVAEFEAEFGAEGLSEADDLRIRLSKATVANAKARYGETLGLVTEKDARAERRATETQREALEEQIDREVQVNQVRGGAFYGLHEWKEALDCYERILELRSERWATRNDLALTLWSLGRLPEALAHHNAMVDHYRRLVEQEERGELANDLARSLSNRGLAFALQGEFDEAANDLARAVAILTSLVKEEGRAELAGDLAKVVEAQEWVLAKRRDVETSEQQSGATSE